MKKGVLIPLIIVGSLLVASTVVVSAALIAKYSIKKVHFEESYDANISDFKIDVDTTDVKFEPSTDSKILIIAEQTEKEYHEISTDNNTLSIKAIDNRKGFEKISSADLSMTIYLPLGTYGDFNYESSTGNLDIPDGYVFNKVVTKFSTGNFNFKSDVLTHFSSEISTGDITLSEVNTVETVNIKTSTGKVNLDKVNCTDIVRINTSTGKVNLIDLKAKNLDVETSTGNVTLSNTIIDEKINIKTSTGDVKLTNSDAESLTIKTSTGDVDGTLLTSKIFYVTTGGSVDVPKSTEGGLCEVESSTGNVTFKIKA